MSSIFPCGIGVGLLWALALLLLWIALPFVVFRVSPYALLKLAIETRRMGQQPVGANASGGQHRMPLAENLKPDPD